MIITFKNNLNILKKKFGNTNNIEHLNKIDLEIFNLIEDDSNDDNLYLEELYNINKYHKFWN